MKYLLILTLLCTVSAPDGYHPDSAKGTNGAKQYDM